MYQSFVDWFHQPFNTGMSAPRWFAFVGLLMVVLILWGMILRNLESA